MDRGIEQAADAAPAASNILRLGIRGPALLYIHDDEPPTITRVDLADEQTFQRTDARDLSLLDALLSEAQRRLHTYREDQFK